MSDTPPRAKYLAADKAAAVLRKSLAGQRGDVTVADAASRSGLALRDAETGLHRLVQVHRGHLSVTEKGDLLFRFPEGFAVNWERRGKLGAAARAAGRFLAGAGKLVIRSFLSLFLLGYAAVFIVLISIAAIALSIAAEDGAPAVAVGYLIYGLVEMIGEALFWTVHPFQAFDANRPRRARKPGKKERAPRHFYDRVNGFFFGAEDAHADERERTRALLEEIRARRGRIGLGDVVRVTGLPRPEAEALLSRLMLDYDGNVTVSDEGALVYQFPDLRRTAEDAERGPGAEEGVQPAAWARALALPAFTGNTTGANVAIVLVTVFVGLMGLGCQALGLPWYLAELPLAGTAGLLALPVLRAPFHFAKRARTRRENARLQVLRVAFEAAARGEAADEEGLREAWKAAAKKELPARKLERELLTLGGEVEIDERGRTRWRFRELELERHSLRQARAAADDAGEREVGRVELSSLDDAELEDGEDDEVLATRRARGGGERRGG